MTQLRVGMIGTGFMGKAHALAWRNAATLFPLPLQPVALLLAEQDAALAATRAAELGFVRSTGNWRELVADPEVDVVDICTPNDMHYPMAMAAIAHGKHVYCEKPLGLNVAQSREMAAAAASAGVRTMVGFNYAKNPIAALARQMIQQGEIGRLLHFRGTHTEDYLADPNRSGGWRILRERAGMGALGDLCHIVSLALLLAGDIEELCADLQVVIPTRPAGPVGREAPTQVENEDQAHALVRFASGAIGTLECSRVAWGRKNGLTWEINGSEGSLVFDQECQNELHYFAASDPPARQGFRRILLGPEHPDYAAFCPAPGHGLGFNEQKVIEVRDFVEAIAQRRAAWPDFDVGRDIDAVLAAMEVSSRERRWVKLEPGADRPANGDGA
ncbi:Gfo/Idh/MocA family protein [Kineobactrum salinum]|uniref:Gfo/Idh/MocA family oxidoreductase n=1 Tax=Kineobactrum salinum TaxID=2708301 RepID=A0A6C0U4B0_9GAMM|nr:Gfo/Idh/MocA family oxidoreductase [Kineobactrum salinum]QIB64284.1 Gfo/Idh/MocA family oxidoreductase [Kineobactrum salinum]